MNTQVAYKIFEEDAGIIKNLFKGINRSRTIEPEKWYQAEIKMGRDGGNNNWYKTGIHCLPSLEDAREYLNNFRTERNRVIRKVLIKGNRRKPTNPKVILADELYLLEKGKGAEKNNN